MTSNPPAPPEDSDAKPNSLPQRVLVVEDEPNQRNLFLQALPSMGFEAVGAASAEEALKLLKNDVFAIAMLDLNLPGMNGMELFELICHDYPHMSVVIVTGYGELETAQRAIRLDVADFLTKPCPLGELELALDNAWKKHLARRPQQKPALADSQERESISSPQDRQSLNLQDVEREHIIESLRRNNNNRTAAAKELGISVRTLYYRLAQYDIM
jgi:DNA-binding NtrC family response regulator